MVNKHLEQLNSLTFGLFYRASHQIRVRSGFWLTFSGSA